jgi:hypothetical protein
MSTKSDAQKRRAVERAAVKRAKAQRDEFVRLVRTLPGRLETGGQMILPVFQIVDMINRDAAWRSPPRWALAVHDRAGLAMAYGIRRP